MTCTSVTITLADAGSWGNVRLGTPTARCRYNHQIGTAFTSIPQLDAGTIRGLY